jgi:hypothetical protein
MERIVPRVSLPAITARRLGRTIVVAVGLVSGDPAAAQSTTQMGAAQSSVASPESSAADSGARAWTRVDLGDPLRTTVMLHALERASRFVANPACQAILTDFRDGYGRTLRDNLIRLDIDARSYLRLILFRDGSGLPQCSSGSLALTMPGSRVVYVCGSQLEASWRYNPDHVVISLLHEMLHTLGLGENPPSSGEITARVAKRCRG